RRALSAGSGVRSAPGAARAVCGHGVAVRACRGAVPLRSVTRQVQRDGLAVRIGADVDAAPLIGADDVDEGHRGLDEDALGHGMVVGDGVQVPVGAIVAGQPGSEGDVGEGRVDVGDHLVAGGEQHAAQAWTQGSQGLQLRVVAIDAPGVGVLGEEGREVLGSGEGVRILGGVHERDGSAQRLLRVTGKRHVDTLHAPGIVSSPMGLLTHDIRPRPRVGAGLLVALGAAFSFGMSGAWARGLIDAGWTPGAAVTARVWVAALILLVPTILALRGRWTLLRRNAGMIV